MASASSITATDRSALLASGGQLEDFVLVNIRGGYKLTDNTEMYARVENLFDEEYEEVYTFGGSGRLAIAGMRINF